MTFKPHTLVRLTLVMTILATGSLICGVFTPFWVFLSIEGTAVGVGLLYRTDEGCTTDSDDSCTNVPTAFASVKYNTPATHDKDHWSAIAGLEVGGAVMGIVLVVLFSIYTFFFNSKRNLSCLNTLMMIAAILTWMPVGAGLIIFAIYHGDAFTNGPDISSESFPWSALICFISDILLVFVTILIRSYCRKEIYTGNAIPASVDSKMGLYPSSKNGLMSKYFAPTSFRDEHIKGLNGVFDGDNRNGQRPFYNDHGRDPQPQPPHQPEPIGSNRPSRTSHYNRSFEPEEMASYNAYDNDRRKLTTEMVLGRKGPAQNVDLDNEGNDVIIYKGKDNVRRLEASSLDGTSERDPYNGSGMQTDERMASQPEVLFSSHHIADRGSKPNVSHTTKPGEGSPYSKRLVLSPSNFSESNVKYNPTYAYRPYSEQVY